MKETELLNHLSICFSIPNNSYPLPDFVNNYFWSSFMSDYKDFENMNCKPSFSKLPKNFIIDEKKTEDWNKEKVKENNKEYKKEIIRLNKEKNKKREFLYQKVYKKINEEMKIEMTEKNIQKIWNFVYERNHANGIYNVIKDLHKVFYYMDSLVI